MSRRWGRAVSAVSALLLIAGSSLPRAHAVARPPATTAPAAVPFGVGEEMVYRAQIRCCVLLRGGADASLKVEAVDTVHGAPTYRLVMRMKGGVTLFKMDDVHRSWLDVEQLYSRRFSQLLDETGYDRDRTYDFLVDQGRYVDLNNPDDNGELATQRPLDDVSFVYHVRTLPLEVGAEYTEPRYYKADGNPVTVRVLRRERVHVPAGEFDTVVLKPIIRREKAMFKEDDEGEIWLSDDDRRIIVKLRGKASVATVTMELQSYTPGRKLVTSP